MEETRDSFLEKSCIFKGSMFYRTRRYVHFESKRRTRAIKSVGDKKLPHSKRRFGLSANRALYKGFRFTGVISSIPTYSFHVQIVSWRHYSMDGATRKMANQPSRTYSYVIKKKLGKNRISCAHWSYPLSFVKRTRQLGNGTTHILSFPNWLRFLIGFINFPTTSQIVLFFCCLVIQFNQPNGK